MAYFRIKKLIDSQSAQNDSTASSLSHFFQPLSLNLHDLVIELGTQGTWDHTFFLTSMIDRLRLKAEYVLGSFR